jgi:hypothetical protein
MGSSAGQTTADSGQPIYATRSYGQQPPATTGAADATTGRRRSTSDPPALGVPQQANIGGNSRAMPSANALTQMPTLTEENSDATAAQVHGPGLQPPHGDEHTIGESEATVSDYAPSIGSAPPQLEDLDLDSDMVDVLDVVDPEVSTLTTLTNMQNSLFVPNLGRFISRRPLYTITPTATRVSRVGTVPQRPPEPQPLVQETSDDRPSLTHMSTITSTMSASRYAVLPHGKSLEGWTPGEKDEVNDHVRHMLHSKRSKIKRGLKGFGQYVSRRKFQPPKSHQRVYH